jgi:hypothetical protein
VATTTAVSAIHAAALETLAEPVHNDSRVTDVSRQTAVDHAVTYASPSMAHADFAMAHHDTLSFSGGELSSHLLV